MGSGVMAAGNVHAAISTHLRVRVRVRVRVCERAGSWLAG